MLNLAKEVKDIYLDLWVNAKSACFVFLAAIFASLIMVCVAYYREAKADNSCYNTKMDSEVNSEFATKNCK